MKFTKSQIVQIIKEEAQKVKKEVILRRQLAAIDKELNELNEVHAGGNMNPGEGGVHSGQKKPVFTKKGTHLVEKEAEEETSSQPVDTTDDVNAMMASDDSSSGIADDEMGTTNMITPDNEGDQSITVDQLKDALANFGKNLNITGVVDFDSPAEGEGEGEGEEEMSDPTMGVDIETNAEDAPSSEMGSEETPISSEPESSEDSSSEPDESNIDECGDNMPMEKAQMQEATNKVRRITEEKNRWAELAGIKPTTLKG